MPKPRRTKPRQPDVIIVGGGIMGCACAWELAQAGQTVVVLERSVPGAEASSAAAGILGAQVESHEPGPLVELAQQSRRLYPQYADLLREQTGIDIEYREGGVLRVAFQARDVRTLAREAAWQNAERRQVQLLDLRAARRLEPALSERVAGGLHFTRDARVDPRRLLRALHIAAQHAGAAFRTGSYVRKLTRAGTRVTGVALEDGTELLAGTVVVAAGSWTTLIEGVALPSGAVRPARGQIVELETPAPLLRRVVFGPGCYLVPRDDGRLLVGSTLEFVGFQRDVTAGAVRDLLTAATALVPGLADAALRSTWSNFRPYTDNHKPLIGPGRDAGLMLATGHYRNGILLAPITARIVRALLTGRKPPVSIDDFRPSP